MAAAAKRTVAAPSSSFPRRPVVPVVLGLAGPDAVAHASPSLDLQAQLQARLADGAPWSRRRALAVSLAISGVLWLGLIAAGAAILKAVV